MKINKGYLLLFFFACGTLYHCSRDPESRGQLKFKTHCSGCHMLPSPGDLTREIWQKRVLPEMGARLGIYMDGYDPMKDVSWAERTLIAQRNYYPVKPVISQSDWEALYNFIISNAPDRLPQIQKLNLDTNAFPFEEIKIDLDQKNGALTTFIGIGDEEKMLNIGNGYGELMKWSFNDGVQQIIKSTSAVVGYIPDSRQSYLLEMGQMTPTEMASGALFAMEEGKKSLIKSQLHRPVYVQPYDFDRDGHDEILLSEFGHYSGQLSLIKKLDSGKYENIQILGLPGVMKTVIEDMDEDGDDDIVAMLAQGDEGVFIFYQEENGAFRQERVLRFSPVYGSSWFELIDFDNDGNKDLITVHGDNADYSNTLKPYHGVRIYLNDGENTFTETFFQPLHGATRVVARDFDKDGDVDIGVTCFFPDFENHPETSFVYFENRGDGVISFDYKTCGLSDSGRWLIAEAFDYDYDGDEDIILGSFTYALTPVPPSILNKWNSKSIDVLILENMLK